MAMEEIDRGLYIGNPLAHLDAKSFAGAFSMPVHVDRQSGDTSQCKEFAKFKIIFFKLASTMANDDGSGGARAIREKEHPG